MQDDAKAAREAEIAQAAYALLAEKGYGGTSMLAVARKAKASNETLYRWYGDKTGLFSAMVRANTVQTREAITAAQGRGPHALKDVCVALLTMVLGDQAILLNRAAAADPSQELGKVIAQEGRAQVAPLIETLVSDLTGPKDAAAAVEDLLGLLIADHQIRRVIGTQPAPDAQEVEARVTRAMDRFSRLWLDTQKAAT